MQLLGCIAGTKRNPISFAAQQFACHCDRRKHGFFNFEQRTRLYDLCCTGLLLLILSLQPTVEAQSCRRTKEHRQRMCLRSHHPPGAVLRATIVRWQRWCCCSCPALALAFYIFSLFFAQLLSVTLTASRCLGRWCVMHRRATSSWKLVQEVIVLLEQQVPADKGRGGGQRQEQQQ